MGIIEDFNKPQFKTDIPEFNVGDRLKVHLKIVEGNKERVQVFEGDVIRRKRKRSIQSTFTVRKNSYGIYVERIFPLHSPMIQKIEVTRRGKVKQARLYYLRKLYGKKAKIEEKSIY